MGSVDSPAVVNIGDLIHSFHAHNVDHISLGTLRGETWAGNLLPMVPGQADTLQFTFTKPGPWLFHCHVVAHADAGMIGIFNITEDTGHSPMKRRSARKACETSDSRTY
jgi:FtsP/CotA-like multicopper oxidase with cupredoxin domain